MQAKIRPSLWPVFTQAVKIMLGSSISIYLATWMNLEFATSAGIITLLTLVTTKLETIKLSIYRLITYVLSVMVALITFTYIDNHWISYGLFIFAVVFASEYARLRATISVNAVIGTHFMTSRDFSSSFILNEFMLIIIGISMAILLNAVHRNESHEKRLLHNIEYTEKRLQFILTGLSTYLKKEETTRNVWEEIIELEKNLEHFIEQACEYNNNVFDSEGNYYEKYFEMRMKQLGILHNLHFEMRKIRNMPEEANIVADFILDMRQHVLEYQDCSEHLRKMTQRFEDVVMHDVPKTREVFESRAKLYHVLMDLEDFIVYKKRYIELVKDTTRFKRDDATRKAKIKAMKSEENTKE